MTGRHIQFRGGTGAEPISIPGNDRDLTVGFLLQEMLQAFDLVGAGVGIADAEGRLLHCNGAAREMLAQRDGIEIAASRILRAGSRKGSVTQGLFDRLPETATQDGGERTAIFAVPRPSGKRPWTLLVRVIGPSQGRLSPVASPVLVFIIDPEVPMKGMDDRLRQTFGLTVAESQLAVLLMQGNSLTECAGRMDIRRSTAASHLQQLFNKTQARTQSQLVSLLFRRSGPVRCDANVYKAGGTGHSAQLLTLPVLVSDRRSESFTDSFIRR